MAALAGWGLVNHHPPGPRPGSRRACLCWSPLESHAQLEHVLSCQAYLYFLNVTTPLAIYLSANRISDRGLDLAVPDTCRQRINQIARVLLPYLRFGYSTKSSFCTSC